MVVMKQLIFTVSTLGRCGDLERTDFKQFPISEGVVVTNDQISITYYFGRIKWSLKS